MNSVFHEAAKLNNEGAQALRKADCSAAVKSMTISIQMMKEELSKSSAAMEENVFSTSDMAVETTEIPQANGRISFPHVFNISAVSPLQEGCTPDIHVSCAAVIYNLAMVHHCQGGDSYLRKAQTLYSMALRILDARSCLSHFAVLLKLGALNNMLQIRQERSDFENVSEDLSQISSLLHKAIADAIFEESTLNNLFLNMLLFCVPTVAPAA